MEDQTIQVSNEAHSEKQLFITESAIIYLKETVKWSKFLSIMGFIASGIMVLAGLFASVIFSTKGNSSQFQNVSLGYTMSISVLYILIGLLYFFPTLYLLKFSNKTKLAISSNDSSELSEALKNQKSLYKFSGIMMIITIGIYVLFGVGALIVSIFA